MKPVCYGVCLLSLLLVAGCAETEKTLSDPRGSRPNVLLIMADDLGFSDVGCYGGEIDTPNLDRLAKGGLRFTQFYNTGRCWPSRAAVLTGYYAQHTRRDSFPNVPEGVKAGGKGKRPAWAKLLPERLRPLGYRSYHSGKWHVDGKPVAAGFDRSYWLDDYDRYFNPRQHFEDDVKLPPVPPGAEYYASTAIADHAIKVLKEHARDHADKPFFEYLAFIAPHFPLHALPEDIARYKGKYLAGWDEIRERRWRRMTEMGIVETPLTSVERGLGPPYAFPDVLNKVGPNEVNLPVEWSQLSKEQREFQAEKMAIHAAMVTRMDREIGRVLEQIKSMGAERDTLVLFMSDNGASAELMVRGDGHDHCSVPGSAGSYLCLGPGWSGAANTPFRRHKTWTHEGGIATPLIVRWPAGIADRNELRQVPSHLIDVPVTILDLAGSAPPEGFAAAPAPPPGQSLLPALLADVTDVGHAELWWLHEKNRALRVGNWKIVASGKDAAWELYDLKKDRAESNDLASAMPEKVKELAEVWDKRTAEFRGHALRDVNSK